ncbi:hypothetical protein OPQ81_002301 [Rhizoctonia solani]|nr:hypothetical protein OPQ81_002301 [Rhizoctonia solani]
MMSTRSQVSLYAAPVSLALFLLYRYWAPIRRRKICHPPSPTSLPLVGNIFSIPHGPEYYAFAELGEQLKSDIVFLNILGHRLIVLNSAEAATEILDKRSASYSDRPQIPMVMDASLMNWSGLTSMIGYNDLWRHHRRVMNNWLNARSVTQFYDLQERQARSLLKRLLSATNHNSPFGQVKNEFFFHPSAMGSLMLQLAYGYKPQDHQDQFFKEARLAFHNVMSAAMQTNFFVNIFPSLLYIPQWFPGTGWRRTGREYGAQQEKAKTEPYEWVKAQVNAHILVSFVAAMVSNPHAQTRAQQELDTVLGPGVFPSISDKERLPYIRNLIDEVLRLYPVAPLALEIFVTRDTIRAIGRDPRHYENPEVFNPDRYIDPNVPRVPAFGWGRRKCAGFHFAQASVFINIASLLATFTFSKKRNSNGEELTPQIKVERNSFMFELQPFDFELKPRSEGHRQLILGNVDGE